MKTWFEERYKDRYRGRKYDWEMVVTEVLLACLLSLLAFFILVALWWLFISLPSHHEFHMCRDEVYIGYLRDGATAEAAWDLATFDCKGLK